MRGGCGFDHQSGRLHREIQPVYGLFVPAGDQVAVGIYSQLNRAMAHLFFHVDRALPVLQEQTRERVAEIMKPDFSQLGLGEQAIEHAVTKIVRMQ